MKAIFFFHPAVWFIESRLSLEREMACDDAVLAANFSPRAYAESLLGLAEKSFLRRGVQLAQAAVGHVQQLKVRIVEILRKDRAGIGRVWKPAVVVMAVAGIVGVYGVSHAPRLFAFSTNEPQLAFASTASQSGPSVNELRLQPVNLAYADRPKPANPPIGKVERNHLPITHRVATKPRVLLAQRALEKQIADNTPPMMQLSDFPVKLAPALVLVVFQGEQFGADGPIFWRVTVVHLTPAQQRLITGGVPKQI